MLQFAVLGIAALVLVFWDQPTGKVIIVPGTLRVGWLAIIEFLGRPPSPHSPGAGGGGEPGRSCLASCFFKRLRGHTGSQCWLVEVSSD